MYAPENLIPTFPYKLKKLGLFHKVSMTHISIIPSKGDSWSGHTMKQVSNLRLQPFQTFQVSTSEFKNSDKLRDKPIHTLIK